MISVHEILSKEMHLHLRRVVFSRIRIPITYYSGFLPWNEEVTSVLLSVYHSVAETPDHYWTRLAFVFRRVFAQYARLATYATVQILVSRRESLVHYALSQCHHSPSSQTSLYQWQNVLQLTGEKQVTR